MLDNVNLEEIPDEALYEVAGAQGTGLYGTMACCWCVPWYSGWTKCCLACDQPRCS